MTELKIKIPTYSLGEELLSSISHGIGTLLGVTALVLCVIRSVQHGNPWAIAASIVYGITLILLYCASTIYHALRVNRAKQVFRVLDHCNIFLLIAGTYTPYTLVSLNGKIGWILFGVVWAAAILGIIFNAISVERFKVFSMICYLAMGWVIVFAFRPFLAAAGWDATFLLLAGGVAYSVGAILYGVGKKVKYMHSIWHFFVLAGSILHFFSIYLYVV